MYLSSHWFCCRLCRLTVGHASSIRSKHRYQILKISIVPTIAASLTASSPSDTRQKNLRRHLHVCGWLKTVAENHCRPKHDKIRISLCAVLNLAQIDATWQLKKKKAVIAAQHGGTLLSYFASVHCTVHKILSSSLCMHVSSLVALFCTCHTH